MKYRAKSVVIEAVRWTGNAHTSEADENLLLMIAYRNGTIKEDGENLVIKTPEGERVAQKGDFIIVGEDGEFYPCKPDIFEKTYEPV
jgi:hypothetical protein